jgi:hypothetical protein
MPRPDDSTELCRSGEHRIVEMFDMALLVWPGGEMIVGDHASTDPQCALINAEKGWCVSGGQGLEICLFEDGLPQGAALPESHRIQRLRLWRDDNPPPDGERFWFVADVWPEENDLLRALVNTSGQSAFYRVDVRTLRWQKL